MRILVTGKSGQLSRSLAEKANGSADLEMIFAARPELDLEKPEALGDAVRKLAPDVIINAAAYTAVDKAEEETAVADRVNGEAPGELGRIAAELGAPIIHISTDYVFDGTKSEPYVEEDPVGPIGAYGRSKLLGEENLRKTNPTATIMRTSWVYSPFGKNFVGTMLAVAENRDKLAVVDDQIGNPTNALDLADALLAIVATWQSGESTGRGELYNCAGMGETSWWGFARHIFSVSAELDGPVAEVEPISTDQWPTPAKRPANSRLDSAKFERDFGFHMPDWKDSSAEVVRRILS